MNYPIGIQTFEDIRTGNYYYADKTMFVDKMVRSGKVYFLSRPRRFGKSLFVSTLKAYFMGRKELFKGLYIDSIEKEWAVYPVLHFDFSGQNFSMKGELENTLNSQMSKYEKIYGIEAKNMTIGDRFKNIIEEAYKQTSRKTVVLIDEYDKPILDVIDTPTEEYNRNILSGFYSMLKGADESLRFSFITGVTKFSKVGMFSGANQLLDISLNKMFDTICGITEEELYTVFAPAIEELAEEMEISVEDAKTEMKKRYDGYHFSKRMIDVYNPFSVLNAFYATELRDYWFTSGTPTYLIKLLNHTNQDFNQLAGKYYEAKLFEDYRADIDAPLPIIYQAGYLTIKDYDKKNMEYLLDIPNNEVRNGLLDIIAANYFKNEKGDASSKSKRFCIMLEDGKVKEFMISLTAYLAGIPYSSHESLKDPVVMEKHFQYTVYLIVSLIGSYAWRLQVEKEHSYGRADFIIETKDYVYILEFKLDGTAAKALEQIEEKGYALPYADDPRKLRKIGIAFSSETKTVNEWQMVEVS